MMHERMHTVRPQMLVIIVDDNKVEKVSAIMRKAGMHLHFQCRGEGTATSEIMDVLGLCQEGKSISLCMAPKAMAKRLLSETARVLNMYQPGNGIAFTVPVSGISLPMAGLLDGSMQEMLKNSLRNLEKEVMEMKDDVTYELILAVVNQGFSEEVMETAKKAGATGGTVLHTRRLGLEEPMKFWGISVQEEKELIIILSGSGQKKEIMRAIGKAHGMQSKARGMVVSIPVTAVEGIEAS